MPQHDDPRVEIAAQALHKSVRELVHGIPWDCESLSIKKIYRRHMTAVLAAVDAEQHDKALSALEAQAE